MKKDKTKKAQKFRFKKLSSLLETSSVHRFWDLAKRLEHRRNKEKGDRK
jgi:hypothetical protein